MTESIAFIGLGAMGGPMAQNIIRKGSKVSVYDVVTEKMDPVVKVGGSVRRECIHAWLMCVRVCRRTRVLTLSLGEGASRSSSCAISGAASGSFGSVEGGGVSGCKGGRGEEEDRTSDIPQSPA